MPYQEGQTATNPSTGQKYIFQGGNWSEVPAAAAKQAPDVLLGEDLKQMALPALQRGGVALATAPASMGDMARRGAGWLAEKALPEGWGDKAADLINKVPDPVSALVNPLHMSPPQGEGTVPSIVRGIMHGPQEGSYEKVEPEIEKLTGLTYHAQTPIGKAAEKAIEFAPSLAAGPGGVGRKLAMDVGSAGLSEGLGQGAEAAGWDDAAPWLRTAGAIAGAGLPNLARRAVTPLPVNPESAAQGRLVEQAGTPLTAGEFTDRPWLQSVEGRAMPQFAEQRKATATRSMMQTMGVNADRASPGALQAGRDHLSDTVLPGLLERNPVLWHGPELRQDLSNVYQRYVNDVGEIDHATDPVARYISRIAYGPTHSPTSGYAGLRSPDYQSIRSELSNSAYRNYNKDPDRAAAFRGIRNALDTQMERTIAQENPADLGNWLRFRQQWQNSEALRDAMNSPGKEAARGILNPSSVFQATGPAHNSNLAQLARAMEAKMTNLPVNNGPSWIAHLIGSVIGGAAGHYGGNETMLGAIVGNESATTAQGLARSMVGKAATAPVVQNWLKNQGWLPSHNPAADHAAVARALLARKIINTPAEDQAQ